jgi:hypothetical protein
MSKYKLIKEFPNSPSLGTIQEFPDNNSWSEYWELVEELKVGSYVVILDSASTSFAASLKGKTTQITEIHKGYFHCPEDLRRLGIYSKDCRLATEKEILDYNSLKEGDTVILFKHRPGSSYTSKINSIGTIRRFISNREGFELKEAGGIWYTEDCRKATPEEIRNNEKLSIGGYELAMTNKLANFGCQSFTLSELQAYKRLVQDPINTKLSIHGTDITSELLDKIIERF